MNSLDDRPIMTALGDSGVNLLVRVWIQEAAGEQRIFSQVLEAGKPALDQAGIEIPYLHLRPFVDDVTDRVRQKAAALSSLPPLSASPEGSRTSRHRGAGNSVSRLAADLRGQAQGSPRYHRSEESCFSDTIFRSARASAFVADG